MRLKNVRWHVLLTSESLVYGHAKEDTQEYNWLEYMEYDAEHICFFSLRLFSVK